MLGRVILGLFVQPEESRLYMLLFYLSEPVIMPFRILFSVLNIGQGTPFDMPFMAACLGLSFLQLFLPII